MMKDRAQDTLVSFAVPDSKIYAIGLFDKGVTVLSQQTRALNLVWALTETATVPVNKPGDAVVDGEKSIAIVGGGFSGLAAAAALVRKGARANITIFEQRDTLLPLQQGSDTRWVHPNIYNWPGPGSEVNSAMLPILNWTAARASDVAVRTIVEWRKIVEGSTNVNLYCNTRHIKIDDIGVDRKHKIEWVGEARDCGGVSSELSLSQATGKSENFDIVILAIGFGVEREGSKSYWRNDMSGQPHLERARLTYIVSGQGDGAMIDLLRLRVSNFRQDRILSEIFRSTPTLRQGFADIFKEFDSSKPSGLIRQFQQLESNCSAEFSLALKALSQRLRRDTEVILNTLVSKISELFETNAIRISFQNRVLVYLLYRCGGFSPISGDVRKIARENGVTNDRIIVRRGTDRKGPISSLLPPGLVEVMLKRADDGRFAQTDKPCWSGGYFGQAGTMADISSASLDSLKKHWRMEYLPGPTALIAGTFCSALAGYLGSDYGGGRLRITLHRAIAFGPEEVLQQCCRYFGRKLGSDEGAPGRTFPAHNATIGAAYRSRRIIRSLTAVEAPILQSAMRNLKLNEASSDMSAEVRFLLAIPLLEGSGYTSPSPVSAVLYIDSIGEYHIDDEKLNTIVSMAQDFIDSLENRSANAIDGIYNASLPAPTHQHPSDHLLLELPEGLEVVSAVAPPRARGPFQLNFEHSDFIPTH